MAGGNGWTSFFDRSQGSDPPRDTLVHAMAVWNQPPGTAIDLGCGAGRDALALLERDDITLKRSCPTRG